jgi:5'-methylthioadenosine phosphorylase
VTSEDTPNSDQPAPSADSHADRSATAIGVIGGSGFYRFFDADVEQVAVTTPFGAPSDEISVGTVAGRTVAFLPRHGRTHAIPPHRINYRANLWALRSLGVRQVIAPSAVGSLRPEIGPGRLVVPDQLVDRTRGRVQTYYDGPPAGVVHVAFADPYCPVGRSTALTAAASAGWDPVDGGTLVVVDGPRFSTRAESQWHAASGWSIVGMTGHPEAVLARELALCYTPLALVTDHDAGVDGGEAVTHEAVLAIFRENVDRLRSLVVEVVRALPGAADVSCPLCPHALDGLTTGFDLP